MIAGEFTLDLQARSVSLFVRNPPQAEIDGLLADLKAAKKPGTEEPAAPQLANVEYARLRNVGLEVGYRVPVLGLLAVDLAIGARPDG